jgi:transposase
MPAIYTTSHKICLLEGYLKNNSYAEAKRILTQRFPHILPPHNSTISRLLEKFRVTGSVANNYKVPHTPSVITEEKLVEIQGDLLEDPRLSLRRLSQQCDIGYGTAQRTVKNHLKLKPYKVQVVHELLPGDHEARVHYCEWITDVVEHEEDFLDRCFFSDEAWFELSGYVNSQNSRYWSTDNPHLLHNHPLHPVKVGVWAAMTRRRIFFTFFNVIVNSEVYKSFIDQLVPTFSEDEVMRGWLQQDGATAHTSGSSMNHLRVFFGERIISRGLWPARSPDLSPPDFFLWGYLKDRVYRNAPQNIEQLKVNISDEISLISPEIMSAVSASVVARAHSCKLLNGAHFQHM